ncbi:MAG: hypothetical protein EOO45_17050 [Flavobacterium sp.]|nr:MAG: hypothetical protein EOO45_17050 [Flavobacterium sp.]
MAQKFHNKYRILPARAQWWNYASEAVYFITICTKAKAHFFGDIFDGEMQLSVIGKIVEEEWLKTFEIREDMNLEMGSYIVMPNHFHAIIGIGENEYNAHIVYREDNKHNNFGPQSKNLAAIVRGFKSAVTKSAKFYDPTFNWQPLYHDHIIRNEESLNMIDRYIVENPMKWSQDKFHI